jgi:SPP1 gp7 family putative phage head morphogenesis protein
MATARAPRVSTRVRRTSPRQGPRPPMALVERMQVAVIGLVNAYIDRLMREIAPELRQRFDDAFEIGDVGGQVALGEGFLRTTFHAVDRQAAEDLARAVPIPASRVLKNSAKLEKAWVHNNTELINLEQRARVEVRKVIEGPLREGIRVEEVRKRIEERLGVVRSRAELIARDQTLKLYGQIQQQRQEQAGIKEYTWSISEDERVRPDHADLDGRTFRWDDPPIVDKRSGRRAHPGGDFQCRCAAVPLLPDGEEEQESPPEPLAIEPAPPENDVALPDPAEQERMAAAAERAQEERTRELRAEAEARREAALVAEQERQRALAAAESERAQRESRLRIQRDFRVVGDRSEWARDTVSQALSDAGYEKLVGAGVRPTVTLTGARMPPGTMQNTMELMRASAAADWVETSGTYYPEHYSGGAPVLKVNTNRARMAGLVDVGAVDTPSPLGMQYAPTVEQVIERTTTHEFGHAVHMHASVSDRGTYERVDRVIKARFSADDREKIGKYSGTNDMEYFAEAFAAYHHFGDWLKRTAPKAYAMVEHVMRIRGML